MPRLSEGDRWRVEAMRSYSSPVLLWFTRGQGRITVAGVTRGYGPHNAIYLPPGTMHGYDMLGQVFGTAVFFPRNVDLSLPGEPVHFRFREAQQQAELNHLIDNLQRELDRHQPGMERALEHHAGLLAVWLERQMADDPELGEPHRRAADRLAAAYTALVERDFAARKGVAQFAAELGVTPTHLSRACKAASGRSASELLLDRVHYEARRLLAETGMPIKDVARQLGFSSPAYFTRAFQARTGSTPSAFRKNR